MQVIISYFKRVADSILKLSAFYFGASYFAFSFSMERLPTLRQPNDDDSKPYDMLHSVQAASLYAIVMCSIIAATVKSILLLDHVQLKLVRSRGWRVLICGHMIVAILCLSLSITLVLASIWLVLRVTSTVYFPPAVVFIGFLAFTVINVELVGVMIYVITRGS